MDRYLPLTLIIVLFALGCISAGPRVAAPSQTVMMSARVPMLTPLPETQESQEKGGIGISVAAFPFTTVRSETVKDTVTSIGEQKSYSIGQPVVRVTPMRYVDRTTTPLLKVQPDRLCMQVKIQNKLARVFRGQGTVVQFLAGGKNQPVDPSGYGELINIIIPPRGEAEIKIYGPLVSSLPEKTTIGLFLYDVVTATDAAGNVTEKQNFEWFYDFSTRIVEDSAPVTVEQMQIPNGPSRIERTR